MIDLFLKNSFSAVDFLDKCVSYRISQNPSLSVRSLSNIMGISNSTLSAYLNRTRKISSLNALKIAKYFGLENQQLDLFLYLVIIENCDENESKLLLKRRIESFREEEDEAISSYFSGVELAFERKYYLDGHTRFRILRRFQCSKTKKLLPQFSDRFFSDQRQVAGTSFFIPNQDGTYKIVASEKSSPDLFIKPKKYDNSRIEVQFNRFQLPEIKHIFLSILGTSKIYECSLSFKDSEALLKGYIFDMNNPKEKKFSVQSFSRI